MNSNRLSKAQITHMRTNAVFEIHFGESGQQQNSKVDQWRAALYMNRITDFLPSAEKLSVVT